MSIKSRKANLFRGLAYSVTASNNRGVFDILPGHANYVTLIDDLVTVDIGMSSEQKIKIEKGVLTTTRNKVEIYAGL